MALSTFGPAVDLHAGGSDLRFPHHAYEAALAEAVTGVRPFARAWVHVGLVTAGGRKMATSAGNPVLVRDLLAARPATQVRTLLLDRRHEAPWEYAPALLDRAADRLDALRTAGGRPGRTTTTAAGATTATTAATAVLAALLDDLDIPRAIDLGVEDGGDAARLVLSVLDPSPAST
jgi:cysteinyl-tRNA synthetase